MDSYHVGNTITTQSQQRSTLEDMQFGSVDRLLGKQNPPNESILSNATTK